MKARLLAMEFGDKLRIQYGKTMVTVTRILGGWNLESVNHKSFCNSETFAAKMLENLRLEYWESK